MFKAVCLSPRCRLPYPASTSTRHLHPRVPLPQSPCSGQSPRTSSVTLLQEPPSTARAPTSLPFLSSPGPGGRAVPSSAAVTSARALLQLTCEGGRSPRQPGASRGHDRASYPSLPSRLSRRRPGCRRGSQSGVPFGVRRDLSHPPLLPAPNNFVHFCRGEGGNSGTPVALGGFYTISSGERSPGACFLQGMGRAWVSAPLPPAFTPSPGIGPGPKRLLSEAPAARASSDPEAALLLSAHHVARRPPFFWLF